MVAAPRYRELAEKALGQAAAEQNSLPTGRIPTDIVMANAAKTQALATIAVAQALLEIGDVLRENLAARPEDLHG